MLFNNIMSDESQLPVVSDQLELHWSQSNKVAELCKSIVEATAIRLQGKNYIPIEGWQSIAAAWGCTPSTEEPLRTEDGYRVKAILRRDLDGAIISTAYGFVGDDEPIWAKRSRHANEAMAQTRAMSRVCANKFRFIPVLMKIEDLATTPYEEMPDVDDHPSTSRNPEPPAARRRPPAPKSEEPEPPASTQERPNRDADSSMLQGIVTQCRKSTFEGRDYYWAQIADKAVFTSEEQLGQRLFEAVDQIVEALVKPARKAGRWIIQDLHYAPE
jgi:hypothetical protein